MQNNRMTVTNWKRRYPLETELNSLLNKLPINAKIRFQARSDPKPKIPLIPTNLQTVSGHKACVLNFKLLKIENCLDKEREILQIKNKRMQQMSNVAQLQGRAKQFAEDLRARHLLIADREISQKTGPGVGLGATIVNGKGGVARNLKSGQFPRNGALKRPDKIHEFGNSLENFLILRQNVEIFANELKDSEKVEFQDF